MYVIGYLLMNSPQQKTMFVIISVRALYEVRSIGVEYTDPKNIGIRDRLFLV